MIRSPHGGNSAISRLAISNCSDGANEFARFLTEYVCTSLFHQIVAEPLMPMIEAYLTHIDDDETSIFRTYLRPVGNSRQPLNRTDELDRKVRSPLPTGIRAICVKSQLQHQVFRMENYPQTFIYVSFQWTLSRKKRCASMDKNG